MSAYTIIRGLLSGGVLGVRRFAMQLSMRSQETGSKVELFLPYGMSANPVPSQNADVIVFTIGGTRDHLVGILDDASLRIPGLAAGEFGWQDQNGQQVVFKSTGIVITTTLGVTINGDVHVTGTLTADTDVVGGGKSLKTHKHGGVTTGSGQTGTPV